ncbi:hypothetical protein BRCON_1606 [Candidatus Sumerlaea chitinivorans]|uniref:Uncharacterized protein n=1 Tax=Sumerlaea chitinivorans TaxID=2250252 RepID=A0A2Z4Y7H6_SUMC1|nr:hypothetical protein BRCON_1606 [Candidatus Sumerlaea chitinivorans]
MDGLALTAIRKGKLDLYAVGSGDPKPCKRGLVRPLFSV